MTQVVAATSWCFVAGNRVDCAHLHMHGLQLVNPVCIGRRQPGTGRGESTTQRFDVLAGKTTRFYVREGLDADCGLRAVIARSWSPRTSSPIPRLPPVTTTVLLLIFAVMVCSADRI